MNDRMKKHALTIVADIAQGFASLITLFIDYREPFFGDKVFHNVTKLGNLCNIIVTFLA
jgi:hypothetical protein